MRSTVSTKSFFLSLVVIVIIVISANAQQNPIKEYPGIPIITYQGLDYQYLHSTLFDTMKQSGVRAVVSPNLTKTDYDRYIKNSNLLVMPEQQSERVKRYIYKYTEAIYSEWEAEGTPEEEGKVTLYSDSIACIKENGFVRTLPNTPNGTLIYGPMYSQQVHYAFVDIGHTIQYSADFYLMIEQIISSNNLQAEDTVCVIQVTTTKTYQGIWGWHNEHIIAESAIKYGDFERTGQLQRFTLNYNLIDVPNEYNSNEDLKKPLSIKGIETQRKGVGCIQFKVKWKGNSQILRLSVDKIIISDERGRDLFSRPAITDSIKSQIADNRRDFGSDRIAGWIGLDEPWNLDFWAPIRKVQEILETKGAQLYFQFNVGWNGRFGDYNDSARAMKVEILEEFIRRVKKANVWITWWLYDQPCNSENNNIQPCNGQDFREFNLNWAADTIYSKVLKTARQFPNLHYGFSLQTGKYRYTYNGIPENRIREIKGSELLYNTNLALIYGSKLISPWLYFGGWNDSAQTFTGILNYPEFSIIDKYLTLKNIISKRLSGQMGKTLRNLIPTNQYIGTKGIRAEIVLPAGQSINYSNNNLPNIIEYIKAVGLSTDICLIDIGLFEEQQNLDKRYFLLLNRYYSTIGGELYVGLRNLSGYRNWKINNISDTVNISIVANNDKAEYTTNIIPGDGKLYEVSTAVITGGELRTDEIINSNISLEGDLRLLNNSNIFIARNKYYTIKDTIELAGNGYIFGAGYIHLTNTGEIITNNWTRSLYKGRSGNNPRIIWSKYPHSNQIVGYKVYRKIGEGAFSHIATVSAASSRQYIDYGRQINDNPPRNNPNYVEYRVRAVYIENGQNLESVDSNPVRYDTIEDQFAIDKRAIEGLKEISYSLEQNYPNPFNPVTRIRYSVGGKGKSHTTIKVYDIIGREVVELLNEEKESGEYEIELDANKYKLTSGVYIYKIQSGAFSDVKKLLIVK